MKLNISLFEKIISILLFGAGVVLLSIFITMTSSTQFTFLTPFWWGVIVVISFPTTFLLFLRSRESKYSLKSILSICMSILSFFLGAYCLGILILNISGGFSVSLTADGLEGKFFGYGAGPFFFYSIFCFIIAFLLKPKKQKAVVISEETN